MENLEKVKNSLFNSVGFKLALIAFLSLLLMIPSLMIMDLIREREQRSNETIHEVTSIWGDEQTLTAPVLTLQVVTLPKACPEYPCRQYPSSAYSPRKPEDHRQRGTGGQAQGHLPCGHLPVKVTCYRKLSAARPGCPENLKRGDLRPGCMD